VADWPTAGWLKAVWNALMNNSYCMGGFLIGDDCDDRHVIAASLSHDADQKYVCIHRHVYLFILSLSFYLRDVPPGGLPEALPS
jgi:hypothetical protein